MTGTGRPPETDGKVPGKAGAGGIPPVAGRAAFQEERHGRRTPELSGILSLEENMNPLLELYVTFVKLGCVTFGGGYAMLPILERELVEKRHWTTMDDLRDYFSIGQCTPGVIALNVSTFIGEKRGGVRGAVAATLGFLTGPVTIILLIAMFLQNFASMPLVQHAFAGIRVCVCVLIVQAVLRLWKKSVVDPFALGLYLAVFALNAFSGLLGFRIPATVLVILSGISGIVAARLKNRAAGKEGEQG